jgi:hypothetical protein
MHVVDHVAALPGDDNLQHPGAVRTVAWLGAPPKSGLRDGVCKANRSRARSGRAT